MSQGTSWRLRNHRDSRAFSGWYRGGRAALDDRSNRETSHGISIKHAPPDGEDGNTEEDGEEGIVHDEEGSPEREGGRQVDGEENCEAGIESGEEDRPPAEIGGEEDRQANFPTAPRGLTEPPERE